MAEAIRLELNPKRTRPKTIRFADPLELLDADKEIFTVENVFLIARNNDYVGAIEPFRLPPPNKRKKCSTCGRAYYSANSAIKYFPMPPHTSPQL